MLIELLAHYLVRTNNYIYPLKKSCHPISRALVKYTFPVGEISRPSIVWKNEVVLAVVRTVAGYASSTRVLVGRLS